jgi:hypothetical protein
MNIGHSHSQQRRTLKYMYVHIWIVDVRDFCLFNKNMRVRVPETVLKSVQLLKKLHVPIHLTLL